MTARLAERSRREGPSGPSSPRPATVCNACAMFEHRLAVRAAVDVRVLRYREEKGSMTMNVEAVHTEVLIHEYGTVTLEVPRWGAVLSPAESEAVSRALIGASTAFEGLAEDCGRTPMGELWWMRAARSELAIAVLQAAERRTL